MTDERTFTFRSGYTIRVRDDYDPRLLQMTQESYREGNPPPEPPLIEKKVPQKGGTKSIYRADYQDQNYLRSYAIWELQMFISSSVTRLEMAIDPDSIDLEVVEAGRAWAAEQGASVPRDDVLAYIRFVVWPEEEGKEEDSELLKFYRWLNEVGGPSEALVNQFIATFRAKTKGQPRELQADLPGVATA